MLFFLISIIFLENNLAVLIKNVKNVPLDLVILLEFVYRDIKDLCIKKLKAFLDQVSDQLNSSKERSLG